ncbi:MAG: ankyrin repeat domain-containing protein [Anaerolineae bacterium]
MAIRGFSFIPVSNQENAPLPPQLFAVGTVSSSSKNYQVYAVLKDGQKIEHLEKANAAKVCHKIQKCLDNLPGFCKGPECWGEAGFRFHRIRIPNTFETANFSKSGADVFKRCQDLLKPHQETPSSQEIAVKETAPSNDDQTLMNQLLTSLKEIPSDGSLEEIKKSTIKILEKETHEGKVDETGFSIIHYLIVYGNKDLIEHAITECSRLRKEKNSSSSTPDAYLGSFFHFLCDYENMKKVSGKFKDMGFKDHFLRNIQPYDSGKKEPSIKQCTASALVKANADINVKNVNEDTPLHQAIHRVEHPKFVEFLIQNKADLTLKNKEGLTPFEVAFHYFKEEKMDESQSQFSNLLIQIIELYPPETDVTAVIDGQALLNLAIEKGFPTFTQFLVGKGANIHLQNASGQSLFYENLEKAQACSTSKDPQKNSEFKARVTIALSLINKGCDTTMTIGGKTPLQIASNKNPIWEPLKNALQKKEKSTSTNSKGFRFKNFF